MSTYGEPKNGDFATYVEELSRRGLPSQGLQALPPISTAPPAAQTAPERVRKRRAKNEPTPASADGNTAAAPTLAEQARLRQASSRLGLFGFIAICFAVWNLAAYVADEHSSLMRIAVPGLIAYWLFRAAARTRAQSRVAAAALPPLKITPKP